MTLKDRLIARIRENGPLTVAEYMAACLYDPQDGYYATRPLLGGEDADFITAPEASQMFGELLGAWCAHEWGVIGAPDAFDWIELGPGRGVLMQDAQRATRKQQAFADAARLTLVETSAPLRALQAEKIAGARWAESIEDIAPGPTLLIANEFLDCLPIRQFVRGDQGWREKLVGLDNNGALAFGLSAAMPAARYQGDGVREIAPGLPSLIDSLAHRLHAQPGRALLIDYGYAMPEGADTLQALKRHQKVDPLADPGGADLTAHVDFLAVTEKAILTGLDVAGPRRQGDFLRALGLDQRAEALARAHPDRADRIAREHARLTAPDQMGALFLVTCLSSPGLPPPAGF